jgi:hypothetical protein
MTLEILNPMTLKTNPTPTRVDRQECSVCGQPSRGEYLGHHLCAACFDDLSRPAGETIVVGISGLSARELELRF